MNISLSELIYIFSNIFNVYIIFQFIHLLYKKEDLILDKKWKLSLIMMIYYLITTILHILFANPFINSLVGIMLLFLVSFIYITPINEKISKTIFLYFLLTVEDYTVYKICSLFNLPNTKYWASLVNIIILTLILFLSKRSGKIFKSKDSFNKNDVKVILIMAISILLLIYFGVNTSELKASIIIALLFLVILNLMIVDIYEDFERTFISKRDYLNIRNSIDKYMSQIEKEKQSVSEIRKINHDIKNHLLTINTYIDENEKKKASEYINELLPKLDYKKNIEYCKAELINGMLNYKVKEAENKNINVSVSVNIDTAINVDSFDMTVILGNLLDNAIEGAIETDKKLIDIKLYTDRGLFFVEIKNSYKTIVKIDKDHYMTTKDDKETHGMGLKNVRKIVDKNDGYFKTEQIDDFFIVKLYVHNRTC